MLAAVARDTYAIPTEVPNAVDELQDKDSLLDLIRGFIHRHRLDKRVYFQEVLLVCLCKVLSAQNVPQASIVEVLQESTVSATNKENIIKYLNAVVWLNTLLDQLFFLGWRYRAIDLLIICLYGRTAHQYVY